MTIHNRATHRSSATGLGAVAFAAAVLAACGEHTAASGGDATSAYEALNAKLQPCIDKAKTCATDANGDQTKLAACAGEAETCRQGTLTEQQQAQSALQQAVSDCFAKARTCAPAAGAGATTDTAREACGTELRACLKDNAPPLPPCIQKLQTCVEATPAASPTAGTGAASDAPRVEHLIGCVKEAHTCIMGSLPEAPAWGDAGHSAPMFPHPQAGAGAPMFPHPQAGAGAPMFPHPQAGTGAPMFPHPHAGEGGLMFPHPHAGAPAHPSNG
jgi:hypothetical protein